MITKVYILGAGASKPDGVPIMDEFISEGVRGDYDEKENLDIINDFFEFAKRVFPRNTFFNSNASYI